MEQKNFYTSAEFRELASKKPGIINTCKKKKKPTGKKAKAEMVKILLASRQKFKSEYKFAPKRQFKFDFAIPDLKLGIEYEGLFSDKSRHTTVTGYSNDTTKYNLAQQLGWAVLRYTAMTYTNFGKDLETFIQNNQRGTSPSTHRNDQTPTSIHEDF